MTDAVDGDLIFSGAPPVGTFFVSYHRPSLHIPRRDFAMARSDSLTLAITVVQYDDPDAQALLLTGGLGGPTLRMVVRRPGRSEVYDYGGQPSLGLLASISGTISHTMPGTFNVLLTGAMMSDWPARSYYEVQLDNPSGITSRILVRGMLHLSGGSTVSYGDLPLVTDDDSPVLDDANMPVDII